MLVEVDQAEIIEDKNGRCYFKHTKVMEETLYDDRHLMICNFCGAKSYPECRKECPNGKVGLE